MTIFRWAIVALAACIAGPASALSVSIFAAGAGSSDPSTPAYIEFTVENTSSGGQCAQNGNCLGSMAIDLTGGSDTNARVLGLNITGTSGIPTSAITLGTANTDGTPYDNVITASFGNRHLDPGNSFSFSALIAELRFNDGSAPSTRAVPVSVTFENGLSGTGVFERVSGGSLATIELAPVPLSASAGFLLVGLAGLGVATRRRRKAA